MTPAELKKLHEQASPGNYFFTPETMRFFGDTMSNYGVRKTKINTRMEKNVEVWELYRKNPVKRGLQRSAYFTLSGKVVFKAKPCLRDHGEELKKFFNLSPETDPLTLCAKLKRWETIHHRLMERYCSDLTLTEEELERTSERVKKNVRRILGNDPRIKFNRDPRGYSLKIEEPNDFYRQDLGGYGIIAPDWSEE